jgi:hypothetical protein
MALKKTKRKTKAELRRELNATISRILDKNKHYRRFKKKYVPGDPLMAAEYAMAKKRAEELRALVPLRTNEAAELMRLDAWIEEQDRKNGIHCGHANENPTTCPCSEYCYCRTRTCKEKILYRNLTLVNAAEALTKAKPGTNEFGFWWWKVLELMKDLRDAGEQGKSKGS